jgi:uncharacterized protein (DUF1015 family)
MATVLPFKGILPSKDFANKIVTHSADNYSLEQVEKIIYKNPLTYLSVIYPDFIDKQKTSPHSLERFQKIYNRFHLLSNQGYFIQETKPVYYVYKQKHTHFEFNGIIAAISVEDYFNGVIKIHEQTLSQREEKLKEYLKHCKINAEPVLFFYEKNPSLQNLIFQIQSKTPEIVIELDNVTHLLWKSEDDFINQQIQIHFEKMDAVFIGDGHHRSSSSALLAKEMGNKAGKSFSYFLGAFFQEDNLKIYSFHRLLKQVNVPENFIEQLQRYFNVVEINSHQYPLQPNKIGMYWNRKRFLLELKDENQTILDTEVLSKYIISEIFQIKDIRNNPSIQYLPEYTYSINDVEKMVDDKKYQLAFFTYPVSINVVKDIALQHKTMPPKSTYVLPKLLNALVLYSLENSM